MRKKLEALSKQQLIEHFMKAKVRILCQVWARTAYLTILRLEQDTRVTAAWTILTWK